MKFLAIIAGAALALSAAASPLSKREVGGVLTCTGPNATGTCKHAVYEMKKCHQLEAPYHQNINTFAPDGEAFECFPRVYDCGEICRSPTGCTFGSVDFNYVNKFNLSAIKWDGIMKSFDCSLKRKEA